MGESSTPMANITLQTTSLTNTSFDFWEQDLAEKIWLYLPPIFLVFGSAGNAFSFIIMRRKVLRVSSASFYLASLAIADTCVLYLSQIPAWVSTLTGTHVSNTGDFGCKIFTFSLFTSGDVAVWILLVVTVDRFISVRLPLKAKQLCTPRRSRFAVGIIVLIAVLKNVHLFVTKGVQLHGKLHGQCSYSHDDYKVFEEFVRPWIAFTLYAFIPISAMLVLNILIITGLHSARKKRENLRGTARMQVQQDNKNTRIMTAMLLTVSIVFTVLVTPSIVVILVRAHWVVTAHDEARNNLLRAITDVLVATNHSINFFLYCLSGKTFRNQFKQLLGIRNRVQPANDLTEIQSWWN